jgi:RNA ligase (TIGR02306 family)
MLRKGIFGKENIEEVLMPGLVFIGKIIDISPIQDADKIVSVTVVCGKGGKWQVVMGKDDAKTGGKVIVFVHDAIVPQLPQLAFMEKYKWRVKICRFRGAISEAVALPIEQFPELANYDIGTDITELLKVEKYQKPIPPNIQGEIESAFPSFIPKTDEILYQKLEKSFLDDMLSKPVYLTDKYDGMSVTYYLKDDHFGACSRNYELKHNPNNIIFKLAEQYKIQDVLKDMGGNKAIQCELIGEKVQGNPLKIKGNDIRVFDIYDINERQYIKVGKLMDYCNQYKLPMVAIVAAGKMPLDEIVKCASGEYKEKPSITKEGIVVRTINEVYSLNFERYSFKVINPDYCYGI